jgi:hypothetical protein
VKQSPATVLEHLVAFVDPVGRTGDVQVAFDFGFAAAAREQ